MARKILKGTEITELNLTDYRINCYGQTLPGDQFDEVVDAMYAIGRAMPSEVRETAKGGLAVTPTGQRMREEAEASKGREREGQRS